MRGLQNFILKFFIEYYLILIFLYKIFNDNEMIGKIVEDYLLLNTDGNNSTLTFSQIFCYYIIGRYFEVEF